MTRHISSEKARANWRETLDAVANGEVVVIERYGRPVATLAPHVETAPSASATMREPGPAYDSATLAQLKAEIVADLLAELTVTEPERPAWREEAWREEASRKEASREEASREETWREELDELRASLAARGDPNGGETTEEIVAHMRRVRQEVFEAEYAHLYR